MSVYGNFKVVLENPNSTWTLMFDLIKDKATVLDIGCSSGYFDEVLINEKQCVVDGIELDEEDARSAAKICRTVTIGNIEQPATIEKIKEKYDYIIFADVLEHLLDPAKTLANVTSLLKPNGKILFSIPNMGHGNTRLQLLQGNFDYENEGLLDRTHLHFYMRKTIYEMVEKSGLHIQHLGAVTFDIPKTIVREVLSKVGLTSTSEFEEFITSGDSLVYQFVGLVSANPVKVIADKTKAIKPRLSYEKQITDLQADSRSLFKRLKTIEKKYNAMTAELDEQRVENSSLKEQLSRVSAIPGVRRLIKTKKN